MQSKLTVLACCVAAFPSIALGEASKPAALPAPPSPPPAAIGPLTEPNLWSGGGGMSTLSMAAVRLVECDQQRYGFSLQAREQINLVSGQRSTFLVAAASSPGANYASREVRWITSAEEIRKMIAAIEFMLAQPASITRPTDGHISFDLNEHLAVTIEPIGSPKYIIIKGKRSGFDSPAITCKPGDIARFKSILERAEQDLTSLK